MASLSEGSPNVVKEAMACNCPIVATDVGDIRQVIEGTDGCYLTSFDAADVTRKLEAALALGKRTNGRERIAHLDSGAVAEKLVAVYQEAMSADITPCRGHSGEEVRSPDLLQPNRNRE
jgi:teichuronic acid biosynthesis glycosyltransferase TuaC